MRILIASLTFALLPGWAQEIKFPPSFEKLAAKAKETVNITLDSSTLQMASKFLSGKNGDDAKLKQLVSGLKAIHVRSFEFENPGAYSSADLEGIRSQLRGPAWSKIVDVKEKNESSEIFLKKEASQIGGLAIIAAEPTELTVVQIVGPIDPDQLSQLGGNFGIPRMEMGPKARSGK